MIEKTTEPQEYMKQAIELAKLAAKDGEVPVGAVIVHNGEIIGRGFNLRESKRNALAHAEIQAIDEACRRLNGWRLINCEMYVTLEPCPMCAGAIINSRIDKVIYGAFDPKAGSCGSVFDMFSLPFNHKPMSQGGLLVEECSALLKEFFKNLRKS